MSPIYDLKCKECGAVEEYIIIALNGREPKCVKCGSTELKRLYSGSPLIKMGGYPAWVNKVDDYQKRQEDRGIEPTLPHPSQIL